MYPSPAGDYMLTVNNINTRIKWRKSSKLTIKTPERRRLHLALVFSFLTMVNPGWESLFFNNDD